MINTSGELELVAVDENLTKKIVCRELLMEDDPNSLD